MPAIAWREFMTAAHKGVPVAQLPGRWQPAQPQTADVPVTQGTEPPVPQQAVGSAERPMPSPASAQRSGGRPVPPADVGGPPQRRQPSIMDIILGH